MGDFLVKYWAMIWAAITTAGLVIIALLSKTYAKQESVEELKREIDSLESRFNDLPTKAELHNLHLEIAGLRGELQSFGPRLERVQHLSDLLLENELKEKK